MKKPTGKIEESLKKAANSESVGEEDRWAAAFAALDEFPRDFDFPRDQKQKRPGLEDFLPDLEK